MLKIGDEVLVKGKIIEVRQTKDGELYLVEFNTKSLSFSSALVPEKLITQ